jgi:hypothetical protein
MNMTRPIVLLGLLALGLTSGVSFGEEHAHSALRIMINEVQPGAMAAPQYCTLVFSDHRFHSEKADIKHGQDSDRKIYEGQLSDSDWNALVAIIDSKDFRDLKVSGTVPPPVMQDTHPYTISVAREHSFQNMEFLDNKSLKPYEPQIKPLLQWWKSIRSRRTSPSTAPADSKCALDNNHAIFAQ